MGRPGSKAVSLIVACCLVTACTTTPRKDELAHSVYQTHRVLSKLQNDLSGTLNQLKESAADLSARVDAGDHEMRRLRGLVEENRHRLDRLQSQLTSLADNLYRHLGIASALPAETSPTEADFPDVLEPSELRTELAASAASPGARSGSAVAAYQEAQKSLINRDYEAALAQFEDYLQRFPDSEFADFAQFWKADCLLELGQQRDDADLYQRSVAEFERLRRDYPNSKKAPMAMLYQAQAHRALGQTSRAIELLKQLLEQYPIGPAAESAKGRLKELESAP